MSYANFPSGAAVTITARTQGENVAFLVLLLWWPKSLHFVREGDTAQVPAQPPLPASSGPVPRDMTNHHIK